MAAAETAPRRAPVWMRLALALSLGLNLVVAGVVAGAWFRTQPERAVIAFTPFGLRYAIRTLPGDDQALFREASRDLSETIRPLRAAIAEDRGQMIVLLRAETFDAAGMLAILKRQNERMTEATRLASEKIVATLAVLPADARNRFADALSRARVRAQRAGETPSPTPTN
jgi:uncharacterized membrane protein